ncbi:MAG: hypothetical protein ACRDN0_30070 [Trebonia sp.]
MSSIDEALRAHAAGSLAAMAAAELLIAGDWAGRDDFAGFVTVTASPGSGLTVALADWEAAAAAAAPGGGLPCSGGERRMLQVTASLAAGIPVSLRDAVTGLDGTSARLVAGAVLHASGHRDAR